MNIAFRVIGSAFRDTWQELWTILLVQLLFLLGSILIIPAAPAIVALFYYGNRIAHGEIADERDFLNAMRRYWVPAWRWGFLNLLMIGVLTGDYYLIGTLTNNSNVASFIQSFYITLLGGWLLLQIFILPFLFEQEQPQVIQALRNAVVFVRRNFFFVVVLGMLLLMSLILGTIASMLTLAFGGAFLSFASNRAVLEYISVT